MFRYFALEWISAPNSVTLFTVIFVLATAVLLAIIKRLNFILRVNQIPGAFCGFTIFGNAPVSPMSPEEIFIFVMGYVHVMRSCGPVLRVWAGPFPNFMLFTPEAFETVLSSKKLIDKGTEYGFLHPWLGTGLLTSTGSKWSTRRKMLTPAFHFKILEDFFHVFNEQSQVLIQKLSAISTTEKDGFDIYPFISRCTLDIICETAMGCKIEAQTRIDSEYLQAVLSMCRILNVRTSQPLMRSDILFKLSSHGAQQRRNLKILHGFTDGVIQKKKLERKQLNLNKGPTSPGENNDFVPTKKRLAFLDLLVEASKDGELLSDSDIREEVDTFMFEGHDTSTAAISWSLHLIGSHPPVMELVNKELERVFGNSNRPVTMNDLNELKYLECCIKEALRLFPSVPIIARNLREDTVIHDYILPANTTVLLVTYYLHRDPKYYPDPELFQPERFFEENSRGRHPYVYVPFSAGPRNCIGQKFAMMEQKVILANIFRNFHLQAKDKRDEIILLNEVVLRPRDGIRVHLTPRLKESL
ncbi:cytochrome P450 4C1-like [Daphnia pulicaria]|uniref:cytochrome P450 4C1-like n=1 Tax=Daphnia pulicaria TaxID=35523 RepID=UPI001EEB37BA|nr:cytochrome P450 4C1-like [Daphnia pulicaria]